MNRPEYDKTDPISIEEYSQRLIGKSFREVIEDDTKSTNIQREDGNPYGDSDVSKIKRNKGNLGQLIEECFFHYRCNNRSEPDFPEAGVELKVTPYKVTDNGKLAAKERLILTMIDYLKVTDEDFEMGHLWRKSKLLLLVYYLHEREIPYTLDYRIHYSKLFTPPEQDLRIIRHDYYLIVGKIKAGKAHELSEGDTLYLGAATKGAKAADRRKQPYSDIPAKPRAFAFKQSYMTYVLNTYIVPSQRTYDPIMADDVTDSFEDYVRERINRYRELSIEELAAGFGISSQRKPKNLEAVLAYKMLGIKGNHAEEFVKANIVVKTIRLGKNGRLKESMSFPAFRFKDLVREEWDDSTFGNYLRETRFLFVVYKYDTNNVLRLRGCQFWNIPYRDLETDVRSVWEKTRNVIADGLQVSANNGRHGTNLPKQSENRVCHVRPHAKNASDTYELPDGRLFPKQCFWLNSSYIYSQIDDDLK